MFKIIFDLDDRVATRTIAKQHLKQLQKSLVAFVVCALAMSEAGSDVHAQGQAASNGKCQRTDVVKIVEWPGNIQNIFAWVARDQGFLRERCLEAKMTSFSSGPAAMAASMQGGLDFSTLAPDTAYVPASQGMDIKIISFMNDTTHFALVVGKHVALSHLSEGYPAVMKDLVGKKIGVNALGSTADILAKANFIAAGLDPSKASWVAYGSPAAAIAALQNESLDAAQFFGDGMDLAAAATGGRIIGDLRDPNTKTTPEVAALRGVSTIWVAQSAFVKSNPDIVRRFAEANSEAIAWIKDPKNFDAVVKIVEQNAPSPPGVSDPSALLRERVTRYIAQVNDRGSMRSLQAWSDWDVALKRIPRPADLNSLLWETAKKKLDP